MIGFGLWRVANFPGGFQPFDGLGRTRTSLASRWAVVIYGNDNIGPVLSGIFQYDANDSIMYHVSV
jgi:hypothetical protein